MKRPFPVRLAQGTVDLALSIAPILRREMVGLLRQRSTFWITVGTVAATALVPLSAWPSDPSGFNFWQASAAAGSYTWVLGLLLGSFTLIVNAASISTERERETYDLLHQTRIRPAGIVLGKLIASTTYFLLLTLLTFPMVAVLYLLGGIEFEQVLWGLLFVLIGLVVAGIVGLFSSMSSKRTRVAVSSSFGLLIAIVAIPPAIYTFVIFSTDLRNTWFGSSDGYWWIVGGTWLALIGTLFLSLLGLARHSDLPQLLETRAKSKKLGAGEGKAPAPRRNFWARRLLRSCKGGIPDSWNPLYAAALQGSVGGVVSWKRRIITVLALLGLVSWPLYMIAAFGARFDWAEVLAAAALGLSHITLYLTALALPGVAASLVSSERELGNVDFLRSTLLESAQILRGKLAAAAASRAVWIGLVFVLLLAMTLVHPGDSQLNRSGPQPWLFTIYFLPSAAAVVGVAGCSGILGGVLGRSGAAALLLGYGCAIAIFFLIPGAFGLLAGFTSSEEIAMLGLAFSPLLAYSPLAAGVTEHGVGFVAHVSYVVALMECLVLFFLAVSRFRDRWMRDR